MGSLPLMDVWSSVSTGHGGLCVVRAGTTVMPGSSVTSWDTTLLKVFMTIILFLLSNCDSLVATILEGFAMPEGTPVFLGRVECSGLETQLSDCMYTTTSSECSSAGVACKKSSSEPLS